MGKDNNILSWRIELRGVGLQHKSWQLNDDKIIEMDAVGLISGLKLSNLDLLLACKKYICFSICSFIHIFNAYAHFKNFIVEYVFEIGASHRRIKSTFCMLYISQTKLSEVQN